MRRKLEKKKHYDVVAAIICKDGKYLCMQRTRSKHLYISERWEFPGGKIESDETPSETLKREIREEMDWDIEVGEWLGTVEHEYPDFSITLRAYLCLPGKGDFKLLEHLDSKWLAKEEMSSLNWSDADRKLLPLLT